MKTPIILANWKSFKNPTEAIDWLEETVILYKILHKKEFLNYQGKIILCAPFLDLPILREELKNAPPELDFVLGAQNLAALDDKPETGEVTAQMLSNYVSYVLLGHSERRQKLGETPDLVNQKIKIALDNGLKTVVCLSNLEELKSVAENFPNYDGLILYEPPGAIGSGQPEDPKDSNIMAGKIKNIFKKAQVLYGGSVKRENVKDIINQSNIDGVGVGGASLIPSLFLEIIKNVSTN